MRALKKYLFPIYLLLAFGFNCNGNKAVEETQAGSPEKLATAIIESLSSKDEAAFLKQVLSLDEGIQAINNCTEPSERKLGMIKGEAYFINSMTASAKVSFEDVIESGEKDGVNWSKCAYAASRVNYKKPSGIEMASIEIDFMSAGKRRTVSMESILKAKDGWRINGDLIYGTIEQHRQMLDSLENALRKQYDKEQTDKK